MYFFAAHFSKYNKYNWDQDPDPLKRKQLSSIEGFFVTERNVNIYKKKCGSMNLEKTYKHNYGACSIKTLIR